MKDTQELQSELSVLKKKIASREQLEEIRGSILKKFGIDNQFHSSRDDLNIDYFILLEEHENNKGFVANLEAALYKFFET